MYRSKHEPDCMQRSTLSTTAPASRRCCLFSLFVAVVCYRTLFTVVGEGILSFLLIHSFSFLSPLLPPLISDFSDFSCLYVSFTLLRV